MTPKMQLLALFVALLPAGASHAESNDPGTYLLETTASFERLRGDAVLLINVGPNCSKFFRDEKIPSYACAFRSETRFCGHTIQDSVFIPFISDLDQLKYEIQTLQGPKEIYLKALSRLKRARIDFKRGNDYLLSALAWDEKYPNCSRPKDAKNLNSNSESMLYFQLLRDLNETIRVLGEASSST